MKPILIVDDHRLFAEGIKFLLESSTSFEVISIVERGTEVIPFLHRHEVEIVLLDLDLPDLSGFEVIKLIRNHFPTIKVLALSMLNDLQSIKRMIEAGAMGYCVKSAGREELFTAIHKISDGSHYIPTVYFKQLRAQKDRLNPNPLTHRETQVIQLIVEGIGTKYIADKLFLSARTIETHRKNIYRKLGIHTNVELAIYAQKHHLI
jgi:DNA-binding NarL/FixJ family response regulator